MNLFLIFNTFANLIFNFVSSSASVSITGSPSKLLHLIVDVDVDVAVAVAQAEVEAVPEPVRMLLGCRAEAMLRRPTPAFIYNFVQLTLAQAGLWPRRRPRLRLRTRPVCPTALAKSVARFCISFLALGQVGIGIGCTGRCLLVA